MISFDRGWGRKSLRGQLVWFLIWLGITVIALFLRPSPTNHGTHQQLGLPPCPSVISFGRPCPGCGLTTSFTAMVHGDFQQAFRAHPFGPAAYALFTLSAFACLWGYLRERRFNTDSRAFNLALGAVAVVFMVYGIYRFSVTHYSAQQIIANMRR